MAQPKYLDLDALEPAVDLTVKLNGVEHKLKQLSVQDFIQNTSDMQALGGNVSLSEEVALVVKMLTRAFPTMQADDLMNIELAKLWKLLDFALQNNGTNDAAKDAAADPTQAPAPEAAPAPTPETQAA